MNQTNSMQNQATQIKQKVEELQLVAKSETIARYLGEGRPKKYGRMWVYEGRDLLIEYDDYGDNLYVSQKTSEGYDTALITQTGNINSVVMANTWMLNLGLAYNEAMKVKRQQDQDQKENEESKIKEKFQDNTSGNPFEISKEEFDKVVNYVRDAIWTKRD